MSGRFSRWLGSALALAGVLVYLGWQWHFRGTFAYNTAIYPLDPADEWRYTACSRLVNHGYALFSQIYSAQPPLLFESLAAGMRMFGETISGARASEILFGLLGLLGSGWLALELAGSLAGGITIALLGISPAYLAYSHTVEAEGPMTAVMTVALAVLVTFRSDDRRWSTVASGLLLGIAILFKLFAVIGVLPALWLIWSEPASRRRRIEDGLFYLIFAAFPLAVDLVTVSPQAQWQQVVQLHGTASRLTIGSGSAHVLRQFLGFDLGLTLAAIAGFAGLLVVRAYRDAGFFLAWVLGEILMLWYFHPLFPHHPAILLTGLACVAGVGLSAAMKKFVGDGSRPAALCAVCAALAYVVATPRLAHADRHLLVPAPPADQQLVALIDRHSKANSLIAADDLRLADQANRLSVPPLCDPSNVRLKSGNLTAGVLIGATKRYRPALVVASFGIFEQVPDYLKWLASHYQAMHAGGAAIFRR